MKNSQKIFSVKEVASLLLFHPETIYRLIKRKKLKAIRIGSRIRVILPKKIQKHLS